jgi:hypothetical protein
MKLGLNFAAACGLAALLAMSAPATAASFTYDLAGDTTTAYTDPAWPGWSYIDLADPNTGTTAFPGFSLHVGDTIQVTVTLNNPASFNGLDLFLQETNDTTTTILYDQTVLFSLGGTTVPNPSTGFWNGVAGARGGLGFAPGFDPDPGTLIFDKVVVNAVITALMNPGGAVSSIELLPAPTYIGFYNPAVATTPIPGGLLLMMTALGGLGIVARRKRASAT